MPRENDLEGKPDMGGKHGGQAGQPKPPSRPREGGHDEDVVAKRHTDQTGRKVSPTNTRKR
ncbi:hypothetical protein L6654_38615 [Bradyrhizobium sp. WYCCWR 13023]|uniref:Uncharacterized protein n=1 Tax=Bradyrhizobium zhengyangense TaxID=2911009 RepID=A0A9X1RJH5_9BRAD|nr:MULTISPECIES: hypothetical protein [Bradyrhizobium]MCG2632523.1 hypothetical protein [Bradyrhizobium zhengyangense]MCG2642503.1 hypothetical protein [Bradyrhizobium zhengyangense]MCG2667604.1 hypothetical protein [Bradyrhizobium zhengyangense]MDA9522298.1 hypothetical protein [Bradyrhizobium sp. CCBAU 11434]